MRGGSGTPTCGSRWPVERIRRTDSSIRWRRRRGSRSSALPFDVAAGAAPKAESTASTCCAVVASSQDTDTWSSSTSQMLTPVRLGGVADLRRLAGHPGQDRVEERVVDDLHTATGQPCGHRAGTADAPAARSRSARRHRDSSRTSPPSPPAAPARCRYCLSPCPAGCAVRGSATPAGTPGRRRRRATLRRGGRAVVWRAWRARRDSRRAVPRIPLARRISGCCRMRRRLRSRRAA